MKVRCSQIGKIMTNPRKSGEVLSQTAKTYVQDLVLLEKYGIRKSSPADTPTKETMSKNFR